MEFKPKVVILIHSAPSNFARRATIRETWGYHGITKLLLRYRQVLINYPTRPLDPRSLLLFIVGAVNSTDVEQKLATESMVHDDILQGSFVDSYQNMTYKHAAVLKWFVYNCPDASFLLKADDDVFINTPFLYTYLGKPRIFSHFLHQGKLLFCNANTGNMPIIREPKSKWYVSPEEYPGRTFPPYCSGFTILYSADVVLELYKAVQSLPYFFIDDAHITGDANLIAKIPFANTNGLILNREQRESVLAGKVHIENLPFFFGFFNLNEQNIRKLWSFVVCSVEGWRTSPFCQMMKWMAENATG